LEALRADVAALQKVCDDAYDAEKRLCSTVENSILRNACNLAAWTHYQVCNGDVTAFEKAGMAAAYGIYVAQIAVCEVKRQLCERENRDQKCCK
jgi:hypothetical protein